MKITFRKIISLFFICFLFCLFSNDLFAVNIQIDRAKVRIKMPVGWSDGGVINVENKSSEPTNVRVYVADWNYIDSDGSKDFLPANTTPASCADWIKFYPADFSLGPKGKQAVNFVVGIPQGASGGHYAVLFFEVQAGTTRDETKGVDVKVFHRLASLFYVEPEGTIKKQAQLSNFKIAESGGNINVEADFLNIGNVDITARGTFDIISQEGMVLTRAQLDDVYTMPGQKAHISKSAPSSGFSKGKYDVILTFDLDGAALVGEWQIEVSAAGKIVDVKRSSE